MFSLETPTPVSPPLLWQPSDPNPSVLGAADIEKLLKEVGVASNKDDLNAMLTALKGKKLHDLVRDGSKKLASVPSGGAATSAAPAQAAKGATAAAPAKKEEKPAEEEANVDMGGLFGDDY